MRGDLEAAEPGQGLDKDVVGLDLFVGELGVGVDLTSQRVALKGDFRGGRTRTYKLVDGRQLGKVGVNGRPRNVDREGHAE